MSEPRATARRVARAAARRAAGLVPPVERLRDSRAAHAAAAAQLGHEVEDLRQQLQQARQVRIPGPSYVVPAPPPSPRPGHVTLAVGPDGSLPGVRMAPEEQLGAVSELALYTADMPWGSGGARYDVINSALGAADAMMTAAVLRQRRPARVVLLGSDQGFATAAVVDAAERWLPGVEIVCFATDAQTRTRLRGGDEVTVHDAAPLGAAAVLAAVRPGDVLLVAGDLDETDQATVAGAILPALPGGVTVQLRRVGPDLAYPEGPGAVSLLMRAFLAGSGTVDVLLATEWMRAHRYGELQKVLPELADTPGDGLWLETTGRAPDAVVTRLLEDETGRPVPWTHDRLGLAAEYHRYLLAAEVLAAAGAARTVVDVACGEGYGTALLAARGHRVTGISADPAAVAHATARYAAGGLAFRRGTPDDLSPFAAGTVGAVCCLGGATAASLAALLPEAGRVLTAADGLLVVGVEAAEADEARALLAAGFAEVRSWAVRPVLGSLAVPAGPAVAGRSSAAGAAEAGTAAAEVAPKPRGRAKAAAGTGGAVTVGQLTPDASTDGWRVGAAQEAPVVVLAASRAPLGATPGAGALLAGE